MTEDRAALAWLVERAARVSDAPSLGPDVAAHLLAAVDAEIVAVLFDDDRLEHASAAPISPVAAEALRARLTGRADIDESDSYVVRFRGRHVDAGVYVEPLPPERRSEMDVAVAGALTLVDLLAELDIARREAAHDPLTNLMNRRSLAEGLGAVIEQGNRYGTTFSLVMLDLNNFKWFNDRYGHAEGDLLLRQLAKVLTSTVRRADLVARYGGDEFVLVLPHTEPAQAETLLRRVAGELDRFLGRYDAGCVALGFSSGVSHYPADGRDADTLIRRADERLYQAKER